MVSMVSLSQPFHEGNTQLINISSYVFYASFISDHDDIEKVQLILLELFVIKTNKNAEASL